jgi:hypothetical protein
MAICLQYLNRILFFVLPIHSFSQGTDMGNVMVAMPGIHTGRFSKQHHTQLRVAVTPLPAGFRQCVQQGYRPLMQVFQ